MVEADGQKGGIGVGGTSSERVREEGLEHIKKHYPEDSINPAGGSNMTPSSNTGEPSGGKLYGAGGVAGGAMAGGSSSNTGNYLGMSGGNTGYEQGRDAAPAYTSSSEVPGSRSEGFTGNAAAASARANNDPTTGPPPTESGGDPFTAATRRGMMTSGDSNLADEHPNESLEKADKPLPPGGTPSHKLDNPSSIPTAGGERLGNKHWGESDMVPDNPKPRESAAGISSSEGQPDSKSYMPPPCGQLLWNDVPLTNSFLQKAQATTQPGIPVALWVGHSI